MKRAYSRPSVPSGKRLEARGLERRVVALRNSAASSGFSRASSDSRPGGAFASASYTSELIPCWMSERVGSQTVFAKFFTASQIFQGW
jgi:hypothetical protein